jgi:hypothetical protein
MTRAQDNLVRVGLLILSFVLAGVAFAVGAAVSDWDGFFRTVIRSVTAAAAAAAFWAGVEIRTPYPSRTPLRLRRHGEPSQTTAVPTAVGTGPVHPVRIALHPKNSLLAGAIFLVIAIAAWALASRTDFSDDGAVVTIVALAMAPWLTYFTARSALRAMLAPRAIEITSEALTLGPALGYWPQLELPRESIVVIVLPEARLGEISIVLADRTYSINPKHMVDPATVADRIRAAWPERAVSADPDVLALEDLEIAEQRAMTAPEAVVELAARKVARRQMRAALIFVLAIVLVVLSSAWYLNRRSANDRLLTEGRAVAATVTDVDRSSRGPDTMTVSFLLDGEPVTAEIQSGWFTGFRRSTVGGTVPVLVDRDDPTFVRLPESRNISEWIWLALAASALAAVLSLLYLRQQRGLASLVEIGRWGRRTVRLIKPGRHWKALVRAESDSMGQEIWVDAGIAHGTRGVTSGEWATWSCESETAMLLVLDETSQVVTVPSFKPHVPESDPDGAPADP